MTEVVRTLTEPESVELLVPYGIPFPPAGVAHSASEAAAIAAQWSGLSVLKIVSHAISHKSDIGGVRLGVDKKELIGAYEDLMRTVAQHAPDCEIDGVLVQRQAARGIEVIIGVKHDIAFGHVLLFGAGGVLSEVLDDVSIRLLPVGMPEAREMVLETKLARVLHGTRGDPPADTEAVCKVLLQISRVVEEHPEIAEVDLNPVIVHTDGVTVVDALVTLVQSASTP